MSQYNEGIKAFTSGEALATRRRVKWSSSTVVYADADEACIGVTEHACASGEIVSVRLVNHPGTVKLVAAEALSAGASLYAANDGKVQDTDPGSGTIRYIALEAATANNDVIECYLVL
jgi:predicted RecA/RadA family phage recombinase